MPLSVFHPATRAWFERALGAPTTAQKKGWPAIARGESVLLCSPTGTGKTLAAFLAAIDKLVWSAPTGEVRVLYISPLRALAVDVEKNLRAPLAGILEEGGSRARAISIAVRTGDTPAKERAAMQRRPPDILITTPESLYLMLSSRAREMLTEVETVIVDEIHQLVPVKRGAHLWLSLERLERLQERPIQRIGLSATQRPLEVSARALAGAGREVTIVDAGEKKPLKLQVDAFEYGALADEEPSEGARKDSVWPAIHERLLSLVMGHRSTIVFCNSRRLAERVAAALTDLAGKEIALAHHGSIARAQRTAIEEKLKSGEIPCIVATSSLELGIDMGAVDLVVQIESPPQIAAGVQRIGRASHHVGGVPLGVILPKHRGDLLASAASAEGILENDVEELTWPKNPLDVLAQQIVAITLEGPIHQKELFALVRRAAPYMDLPESAFLGVLEMCAGRYPSHAFAGLRPRVTWDRKSGMVSAREGAQTVAIQNAGTIPDRGLYPVFWEHAGKATRVGELDEEMVFESREGDVFLLGASSWRIERITPDKLLVTPAPGEPAKMPFWRGEGPGRSRAFGERIGRIARELSEQPQERERRLRKLGLTDRAVLQLAQYVTEQRSFGAVPSDRAVVIERVVLSGPDQAPADELKDTRVCVLTPLGARVHAPWALAVTERLKDAGYGAPDVVYTDDGIAFRVARGDAPPPDALFLPTEAEIDALLQRALPGSVMFASRFRECAARALLLTRRQPGKRTPLWAQRKRSTDLLTVASQYPEFPILLEAMRECLSDALDVEGLKGVLAKIAAGEVEVRSITGARPSPFARTVLFSFVGSFLYDEDMPAPERRAQALALDLGQLQELMGEADLRALLDPEVIAAHERFLQRLDHKASSADGLHDLLLALGDLTLAEIEARFEGDPDPAIAELVRARRVFQSTIASENRFVAAEDASRVRDALGARVPADLPPDLLEPVREPLADLVLRWARARGPFEERQIDARFGVRCGGALDLLLERGAMRKGAFHPAGTESEWCSADVLGALRGKTLEALKRASRPAEPEALSRFSLAWHGVGEREPLERVLERLEGVPLVFSVLEREILSARGAYSPNDLDALFATGAWAWTAIEPVGASDLKIMIAHVDREAELLPPPGATPGENAARIREVLERRGASFWHEIVRALGNLPGSLPDRQRLYSRLRRSSAAEPATRSPFPTDVQSALWQMALAHEIANDTLEPVRMWFSRGHETGAWSGSDKTQRGSKTREGRWFLRRSRLDRAPSPTEQLAARVRAMLARHGILTRESIQNEDLEGGFQRIYPVLRALEDAGRVQRGLFVTGSSGLQFALPTALVTLRAPREHGAVILSALDPANVWGSVLPWPAHAGRVTRSLGARVVLVGGAPTLYIAQGGESFITFPMNEEARRATARALAPRPILTIDGAPARESSLAPALRAAGYVPYGHGFTFLAGKDRKDKR